MKTVETVGPGTYDKDSAINITRVRVTNIDMGKSKIGRGNFLMTSENKVGPGQYDDYSNQVGFDSKGFIISEKRETKFTTTAGPGDY